MGEIKVRAWDECRKRYFTCPKWVEFKVDARGVLSASNYAYSGDIQELIVEQYTGIKDCNGVEIYEGDIVEAKLTSTFGKYLGVHVGCVIFNEFEWAIEMEDDHFPVASWLLVDRCKVIGNIHQNIELLEGER